MVEDVQVREDDIDSQDKLAQECWHEWRDETWEEEDDGEDGLVLLACVWP